MRQVEHIHGRAQPADEAERTESRPVRFGRFELDPLLCELRHDGCVVPIQRKPMHVLRYLIERRGRVVGKDELLERLWPGVTVSEGALTSTIRDVRRALSETGDPAGWIRTVRGHGYRFVGEVTEEAPRSVAAEGPPRGEPALLLERERELAQLGDALERALAGRGEVCLLLGSPGIGKTRMVEELAGKARDKDVAVQIGSCLPHPGAPALWPWKQILRGCLASASPAQQAAWERAAGDAILPLLHESGSPGSTEGSPREDLGPARAQFRLASGILRFCSAAASERPLVVVLEDLHWADPDTLAVLELAESAVRSARLMIVGTLRDEPAEVGPELRSALARMRATARIPLAGLGVASVRTLLSHRDAPAPASELVQRIHEVTAGNPLFVIELARLLREGRGDPVVAGNARLPVPERVRDLVNVQLGARSDACQSTVRVAAVLGDSFELQLLCAVVAAPRAQVIDAVSEAEHAGLLHEASGRPGVYAFRHSLWRECLYADFSRADVRRLHLRVGEALEQGAGHELGPRLADLARHFLEAASVGGAEKAVQYARAAAARAADIGAHAEAASHCSRALAAADLLTSLDPRVHGELHLLRGEHLLAVSASRTPEVNAEIASAFEAGARLARRAGASDLLARAAMGRARLALEATLFVPYPPRMLGERLTPWEDLLREALDGLGPECSALRARVAVRLAQARSLLGDTAGAELWLRQAAEASERSPDVLVEAERLALERYIRGEPGSGPRRLEIAEKLRRLGETAGSEYWCALGWQWQASELFQLGRTHEAERSIGEARRRIERHHLDTTILRAWEVMCDLLAGRFDEAARRLEQLEHGGRAVADQDLLLFISAAQHVWLRLWRGEADQVIGPVETWVRQLGGLPLARLLLARLQVELGRASDAQRELAEALADTRDVPRDRSWLFTLALAAEVIARLGDAARARQIYALLEPYEDLHAVLAHALLSLGSVARPLGLLALTQGRLDRAVAHLEHALAYHARLGSGPLLAWTQRELATALLRRAQPGDAKRAAELDTHAADTARRLRLPSLLRMACAGA